MKIEEIRKDLVSFKKYLNLLEEWAQKATEGIYATEELLLDLQENKLDGLGYLLDAASGVYRLIDGPPRLKAERLDPSRCDKDYIVANGFSQSNFDLKKIV